MAVLPVACDSRLGCRAQAAGSRPARTVSASATRRHGHGGGGGWRRRCAPAGQRAAAAAAGDLTLRHGGDGMLVGACSVDAERRFRPLARSRPARLRRRAAARKLEPAVAFAPPRSGTHRPLIQLDPLHVPLP